MKFGARCRPETWEDVAPSDSEEQRAEALEQLSAHLVPVLHTAHISVCLLIAHSKPYKPYTKYRASGGCQNQRV